MLLADLAHLMDRVAPGLTKSELVAGKVWEYANKESKNYVMFMQGLVPEDRMLLMVAGTARCMHRLGLSEDKSRLTGTHVEVEYVAREESRDFLTITPDGLPERVLLDVLRRIADALGK